MMQPIVWACGLGVNAAAMAVGFVEHGERYDLAMFADTGGEKLLTYQYHGILAEYLNKHGLPPVMKVWHKRADQTRETLEEELLRLGTLPSIAYGFKTCSQKYKIAPQDKVVSNWQPAIEAWKRGDKVIKLIGYDAGETRRANNYDDSKYEVRYPLREWGWDREACYAAIERAGLPIPEKSACFFCPSTSKRELIQMRYRYPELVRRAIVIERGAHEGNTFVKGLGRHFSWEEFWKADEAQQNLFPEPPEIPCDCFDGND
jgi:hypothetical protein